MAAGTILLVDDVTMFLEIQKAFLKNSPAKIVTAKDGEEALAIVRKEMPSLIFMDLHMPKMGGNECCAVLKADPRFRTIPVVLMTAAGKDDDRQACLAAGCDGFITKPLDRDIYLQKAKTFLPGIERRERRIPVNIPVKFRIMGVTLHGFIRDISIRGVFIAADCPVEEKTVVETSFVLPGPDRISVEAKGRVAWVNNLKDRRKPGLPVGFGVEFAMIGKKETEAIDNLILRAE